MDTAIVIIVVAIAAWYVFKTIRNQIRGAKKGGCGCSGGCSSASSGSCSQDGGDSCSCDKEQ